MIALTVDDRGEEVLGHTVDDVREKDEPLCKRLVPREAVPLGSAFGGRPKDGVAVEEVLSYHEEDIRGSGGVCVLDKLGNHRNEGGRKVKVVDYRSVESILPSKVEVVQGEHRCPLVREVVVDESVRSAMVLHEGRKKLEGTRDRGKERRLVIVLEQCGLHLDA